MANNIPDAIAQLPFPGAVVDKVIAFFNSVTGGSTAPLYTLDDPYNATTWNGNTQVPTKNALRDVIETLGGGGAPADASYITTTTETGLSNETVLGTGIIIVAAPTPAVGPAGSIWIDNTPGSAYRSNGSSWVEYFYTKTVADSTFVPKTSQRPLTFVIDGGGSAITTGAKKAYVQVPYACTIKSWTILGDQSGSIVIDIWKDSYANFPPTVADTITASAKPTISSATKATSSTLTGWTTTLSAGDILEINVDSITTLTKAILVLAVDLT